MNIIIATVITLTSTGVVAAIILFIVAQKFKYFEDPRIAKIEGALPGINCGGCGFSSCRSFAEGVAQADELKDLYCVAGGKETMDIVAEITGMEAAEKDPRVAVILCAGSYQNAPNLNRYDGPINCTIASGLFGGETGCQYGCLRFGDCVEACEFDAIHMDKTTGLPYVEDEKCTSCGACVKACPRNIIELRKRAKKDRKIYVSCRNQEKGGISRKSCSVACIGCGKCVVVCPFYAIELKNFLAYIDDEKCRLCRKCVKECPTGAIQEINFPPAKVTSDNKDKAQKENIE